MNFLKKNLWKILLFLVLILIIWGYFYFETSWILRIIVILLGLIGLSYLKNFPEIIVTITLYLGLYYLYNLRYGLAIPLSVIMVLVLILSLFLFYVQAYFNKLTENISKNVLWLYLIANGLISLELFLAMSFWPVDPKIKSLVIVMVFASISKVFYLYINSMLNLKKIAVFLLVCVFVLGAILSFNWWFGY